MNNLYRNTFDKVSPDEACSAKMEAELTAAIGNADCKATPCRKYVGKRVALLAAALAVLTGSVFAVNTILSRSNVGVYSEPVKASEDYHAIVESLAEGESAQMMDLSYVQARTADEAVRDFTKYIQDTINGDGIYQSKYFLTDETGTENDAWTRRRVWENKESWYNGYSLTVTLYAAPKLSELFRCRSEIAMPDVSYLEQHCTPVEDSFEYVNNDITDCGIASKMQNFSGLFRTDSGGALRVGGNYDGHSTRKGPMIVTGDFTFQEEVVSADGVAFTVVGLENGQIFALAEFPNGGFQLVGYDCERAEVIEQVEHLFLRDFASACGQE